MNFRKINMETWNRADVFRHFIDDVRCVMSLTVDMDITDFLCRLHQKNYKFYPAMMWVVSSAVNSRKEFRMGYDEQGNPGIWDYVSPYYTHFHKEDEQFVKLVTEYHSDFQTFYQRFLLDQEKYNDQRCKQADLLRCQRRQGDRRLRDGLWEMYGRRGLRSLFDRHRRGG